MQDPCNNDSYDHVLKYTGMFGGVQVLVTLIGLVRNKFMALLLGTAGVGFNALFMSMQNFASQCTNLGISFGAVPKLSEYYEGQQEEQLAYYIQVIRLWSMIAAVVGFLFCVAVSPLMNELSFTWGNHTLHYAMLGVSVAMLALTGGETAVLKATRRLGALAKVQIYTAAISVLVSIPFYYYYGYSGVIPVIVSMAAVSMVATMCYSYYSYPLRLQCTGSLLKSGAGMIRLGVAFVLAAAVGSASEMFIRAFLNVEGGLEDVGLYNVGFMLTITYAGMVFSSMEQDYFPRLSAVCKDVEKTNETVNKQMEVSLLIAAPMLVGLIVFLPVLIPLFFSSKFVPVVAMTQVAVLAMFFKAITLPAAYITLARGYSVMFLLLESAYFVVFVLLIIFGFERWGLLGTGIAITLANFFDFVMIHAVARWRYGYKISPAVMKYSTIHILIGLLAYFTTITVGGYAYWVFGIGLTLVSLLFSLLILRQKTRLWEALMRRFRG
jgi:O-antigen/teichoic acid export membrane protein